MSGQREPSGRFVLRIEPVLHCRLRRMATDHDMSLNALCEKLLTEATAPPNPNGRIDMIGQAEWFPSCRNLVEQWRVAEQWGKHLCGAIVFGSAVRGELRSDSDIDLLIVLDACVPLKRQLYQRWDALLANNVLDREISAHFVHLPQRIEDAGGLWLEVAIEGQIFVDRAGQLGWTLLELRRAIAAGRFVREVAHGQPFWRRAA